MVDNIDCTGCPAYHVETQSLKTMLSGSGLFYIRQYNVWGFLDVTVEGVTSKNPHTLYTIYFSDHMFAFKQMLLLKS